MDARLYAERGGAVRCLACLDLSLVCALWLIFKFVVTDDTAATMALALALAETEAVEVVLVELMASNVRNCCSGGMTMLLLVLLAVVVQTTQIRKCQEWRKNALKLGLVFAHNGRPQEAALHSKNKSEQKI